MDRNEQDFQKRLLLTFKAEADEHLEKISSGLLELEKAANPEDQARIVEAVFREAHSLKGAARAVNLPALESACRDLEGVFAALKRREMTLTAALFDDLHRAADAVRSRVLSRGEEQAPPEEMHGHERGGKEESVRARTEVSIQGAAIDSAGLSMGPHIPSPAITEESVRVAKAKLDAVLLQTEGLQTAKQALWLHAAEARFIANTLARSLAEWKKIRPVIRAVETFRVKEAAGKRPKTNVAWRKLLAFVEAQADAGKALHAAVQAHDKTVTRDARAISAQVDAVMDDAKTISMHPCSSVLDVLPRIVRDLCRCQEKQAELSLHGADLEVDRRILEEMRDPLMHLVRNSIDHGIEKPAVRTGRKKPPAGRVTIAISHCEGRKVEILVSDDGAGIDTERIKAAAIKTGALSREEADRADDAAVLPLVFLSGVTTSPLITDISGRGLGLAIVREKVERLGGAVSCASSPCEGTSFRIILPQSLAAFRGIIVRQDEHLFAVPAVNVERAARVQRDEIQTVENRETLRLDNRVLPLVPLAAALELAPRARAKEKTKIVQALVVRSGATRVAFQVDEVLEEQEMLVKGLGKQLCRVRNISGAASLGSGRLVPVLSAADLVKSAVKAAEGGPAAVAQEEPAARKSVLVVEDSITSRSLLKNILEAAGYEVRTAVDGIDALTLLKTEDMDLVVSDVDMPRMNGFDLTAKIREDRKLAELPVVLVTALETREDREHGIDVGANAYLAKSSFDQSSLIEIIGRLV